MVPYKMEHPIHFSHSSLVLTEFALKVLGQILLVGHLLQALPLQLDLAGLPQVPIDLLVRIFGRRRRRLHIFDGCV